MGKTIYQLNQEAKTNFTYDDFPVGMPIKIMCAGQDFNFFYGETGIVIENKRSYLGIIIEFDEPRQFKDGTVQTAFSFNPEDLKPLITMEEFMALPKGYGGVSQDSPNTDRPKNPPVGSSAVQKKCNHEFVLLESKKVNAYTIDTFYCKFCCKYQSNQRQ